MSKQKEGIDGLHIGNEMARCQSDQTKVLLENSEHHTSATHTAGALKAMVFIFIVAVCYGLRSLRLPAAADAVCEKGVLAGHSICLVAGLLQAPQIHCGVATVLHSWHKT